MSRHPGLIAPSGLVLAGVVLFLSAAGAPPTAALAGFVSAAADTLDATVELPAPPVSVTAEPEAAPLAPVVPLAPEAPVSGLAPMAAPTGYNAIADTLTVLVDYRAEADITRDLQNATAEKALAERRVERFRMLARQAEARIEIKASEIKSLDAEIDFAKTEKYEAKRKELEGRKKFAGTEKELLERRRELRQREIELAQATRAYHESVEKVCRVEMNLTAARRGRAAIPSTVDPGAAAEFRRLQVEAVKLEGKVLEAQVDRAGKLKNVAQQEEELGKVRRAVYESQLKVAQGTR
jgi:hypothetical protein